MFIFTNCLSDFERKTRLDPTLCAGSFSNCCLHPQPLKGETFGSLVRISTTHKRIRIGSEPILISSSGKRESVHLLPTLYIKQLPLPSTILPIRGTLGRVQGVVFEPDFCHTNFRTTVAYDKFTNNF